MKLFPVVLLAAACGHAAAPELPRADRYLRALDAGDCALAWEQVSPAWRAGTNREDFDREHCRGGGSRQVTFRSLALVPYEGALWVELPAPAPPLSGEAAAAGEALREFARAAQERRFTDAWAMLAAPLRARWPATVLARDFDSGGALAEAMVVDLARAGPVTVKGRMAVAAVRGGQAELVKEGDAWRVAALP